MVSNTVYPRKPIHDRRTPHRDQSDQEDDLNHEIEDPITSNSDSEVEFTENTYLRTNKNEKGLSKSRSVSRVNQLPRISLEKAAQIPKSNQGWKKQKILYIFLTSMPLVAIYFFWHQEPPEERICPFEILKEKYPKEEPLLWNHLKVGIEPILNRRNKNPAVYLFAHNGSLHAFDLIKDIAAHSSNCFGKKLIPMESEDFISGPDPTVDVGNAIVKYKNKIKEGNVILIANLNEIPAGAARALHTICDTHSPIDKNAVIFLTLTIQGTRKGNANAIAEETLIELWGSQLERSDLDPLITRVTDQKINLDSKKRDVPDVMRSVAFK